VFVQHKLPLAWCPKYRKPILEEPKVKVFLEDRMHTIADAKEYEILEIRLCQTIYTYSFRLHLLKPL